VAAEAGGLQCGFGAGESSADYVDRFHLYLGYGVGHYPSKVPHQGQWEIAMTDVPPS
jgi:hypothetical protein